MEEGSDAISLQLMAGGVEKKTTSNKQSPNAKLTKRAMLSNNKLINTVLHNCLTEKRLDRIVL